jgi:UDP-N-acetylmuramoyl-L-alanyl-D-glutamate--2,6-diaminopimelate ligase
MELTVAVHCKLPSLPGPSVQPQRFSIPLRLLGRTHAVNAGLAATTALVLGAPSDAVRQALSGLPAPRRRMQMISCGRFMLLDDTGSHPESVNVVFETIARLPYRRLHVVVAVRGGRGEELNRRFGESLAIWSRVVPFSNTAVTTSVEAASPQNRVTERERVAFVGGMRAAGLKCRVFERLDEAVVATLSRVGDGDLLLLLGAQGMNAGARLVQQHV